VVLRLLLQLAALGRRFAVVRRVAQVAVVGGDGFLVAAQFGHQAGAVEVQGIEPWIDRQGLLQATQGGLGAALLAQAGAAPHQGDDLFQSFDVRHALPAPRACHERRRRPRRDATGAFLARGT